jgi:hypothetical protein
LALVAVAAVVYAGIALLNPWSLHIGRRWTPLMTWSGSGKLLTKGGKEYPLYLYIYPSPHFSRLAMHGQRPTGGVQGAAWLCTSPGVTQRLNLGGTIYGGWRSTEGSLIAFRLLEPRVIDIGQRQGYFDLQGRWNGPDLVMDASDSTGTRFRSGLKIEPTVVTLKWSSYSDFKAACAGAK